MPFQRNRLQHKDITPEVVNDFFARTHSLSNGCLIWTGSCNSHPRRKYPIINIKGEQRSARVVSWLLHYNKQPPTAGITTTCGTERCVCATHLQPYSGKYRALPAPNAVCVITDRSIEMVKGALAKTTSMLGYIDISDGWWNSVEPGCDLTAVAQELLRNLLRMTTKDVS